MKNKTELSSTDVCVRMSKAGLEGGGLGVVGDKRPPSPHSPAPSPPRRAPTPPLQTQIKCESPIPLISSHAPSPRPLVSPPATGPGAEVKGKPGTAIPSGSVKGVPPRPSEGGDESASGKAVAGASAGNAGGRLTFFKEGKFLLELSHRTDMGASAGWVPVKSKTYWPPPSSTTTTTTQLPLRHDTPTSQSISDDCSSLNSSPWTGEHVRKQSMPRRDKSSVRQSFLFHWHTLHLTRDVRKKIRLRRNPFACIVGPVGCRDPSEPKEIIRKIIKSESGGNGALQDKKSRLESRVRALGEKLGWVLDSKISLQSLFEKRTVIAETVDPTFVSPRKRYLRQMESDQESLHRKKLHSGSNSVSHISGDRPSSSSSPSHHHTNRSAINSQTSSVYSIDSILNNESANRKSDSFLRTLLKPETSVPQSKPSVIKEHSNDMLANTVKVERQERTDRGTAERLDLLTSGSRDRKDPVSDLSRISSDRYELGRYGSMGSLASLYGFTPYLDHRYMMLQSLAPGLQSLAPGLVPAMSSQQPEMAQAVAVAAAAAAAAAGLSTYPLSHLHPSLAGAQYQPLLAGGLSPGHTPPTSISSQISRHQAQTSRSSPHPLTHSPSPKPPQAPSTPASPHLSRGASPRGASSPWHQPPPAHPHSPQKPILSPQPSPPPQDAPLNLSKPRNHLGK
ncbi:protein hairless isoform X1 [Penaeus vannamei]